jgi:hypothetical protein
MTWNYRIIKYRDSNGFGLHEVYYDEKGRPSAMTKNPVGFACELDEGSGTVISALCMALTDALLKPVLDEYETWPGEQI